MIARRACNHLKHRARIYVGQLINKHQDMTASGTTQGQTREGGNKEEKGDDNHTRIGSQRSMGEWSPTPKKPIIDQAQHKTRGKILWSPQQSTDYMGNHDFQQDQEGVVIRTNSGQPLCNYCLIPSHARQKCILRIEQLMKVRTSYIIHRGAC